MGRRKIMEFLKLEQNMEYLNKLDENQRVVIIKILARLANADGKLDDSEKEFIRQVAKVYNIPEKRIEEILNFGADEDIIKSAKIITNRKVALELIKEMCILAHADNELTESETLFIGRVGQAMGVELEKIQQISQWVIERIIWMEEAKIIFEEV